MKTDFNKPKLVLMKKKIFTTNPSSWCLGSNWLKGLIPLLALFVFALPMQTQAQQAPNCSNFSPAINENGDIEAGYRDFITNPAAIQAPMKVTLYNQWGGVISTATWNNLNNTTRMLNVCQYLGKKLEYSVETPDGKCNQGVINLNGTPGVVLTSALDTKLTGINISEGKIYVYCGQVPAPSAHVPTATTPCGGSASTPKVQPDWVMVIPCDEVSDIAETIFRTWEVL